MWVRPGSTRSGITGLGKAYPSPCASVSFQPLCPFLAIMGIFPDMGTSGTRNKIRKCYPLKQKPLAIALSAHASAHSARGCVCSSAWHGWSRGAEEITLLNWDLKTRSKPNLKQTAVLSLFFLFKYLTLFSPIKVTCTLDINFRNFRKIFSYWSPKISFQRH